MTHQFADELIVAVDDKFTTSTNPEGDQDLAFRTLSETCEAISGTGVQLKLNTILRVLGHRCIKTVEEAGLKLFGDFKFVDVGDTLLADIRALSHYSCIRRITFWKDVHPSFVVKAREIMPNTSFLPVGVLTDQTGEDLRLRGFANRKEAVHRFSLELDTVFGESISEVIMSPKDIASVQPGFFSGHRSPVTPAVRPVGLPGNEANDVNATNVEDAIRAGASALVIGSPIMKARVRRDAVERVLDQIGEAHAVL